jgi:mRNA interferase HigB
VNVISRRTINDAMKRHPVCASWLSRWWQIAKKSNWRSLDDVRQSFVSADQVGNRLVFDANNGCRLIVGVSYASGDGGGALFVKAFLTHTEYEQNKWRQ